MKGRLLQFQGRDTSRVSVRLVWRLGSGIECLTEELADGRTYVEVRTGEMRQCSGLFGDPVKAAEWAIEAQDCFIRYGR